MLPLKVGRGPYLHLSTHSISGLEGASTFGCTPVIEDKSLVLVQNRKKKIYRTKEREQVGPVCNCYAHKADIWKRVQPTEMDPVFSLCPNI